MGRIVVCGYMIRHPVSGNLLAYFHYVLGLRLLGHEVLYFEESGWPGSCYDPHIDAYSDDPEPGLQILNKLIHDSGFSIPVCFLNRDTGEAKGLNWNDAKDFFRQADLLLNIGGVCWLPEFHLSRRRVFVDMDPLFTQLGKFGEGLSEHHLHFSYGANIGRPGCSVPDSGIDWRPTAPPVVPEIWNDSEFSQAATVMMDDAPFTTIASWSAYGGITYRGEYFGQKGEEFTRLKDLPNFTCQKLEIAVSGGHRDTMDALRSSGWSIRSGGEISKDVTTYRNYIASSRGELSAAKNAYVKTRSGWFSDRSVCYLASGLPVILQDTGFSDWLPTGKGVLAFSSIEEAADCIHMANADYTAHRAAAAQIAQDVFSYKVVLPKIIEEACCA